MRGEVTPELGTAADAVVVGQEEGCVEVHSWVLLGRSVEVRYVISGGLCVGRYMVEARSGGDLS